MNVCKFLIFSFAMLLINGANAETYSCTSSLASFGRPDETQTFVFQRLGKSFLVNSNHRKNQTHLIMYESRTDLVVYEADQFQTSAGLLITQINKISNKYIQTYINSTLLTKDAQSFIAGDCVIF